jgi:hypothetical protein
MCIIITEEDVPRRDNESTSRSNAIAQTTRNNQSTSRSNAVAQTTGNNQRTSRSNAVAQATRNNRGSTTGSGPKSLCRLWDDFNYDVWETIDICTENILENKYLSENKDSKYVKKHKKEWDKDDLEHAEIAVTCLRAWRKKWGDCSQIIDARLKIEKSEYAESITRDIRRRERLNRELEDSWGGWLQDIKEGRKPSWKESDMSWDKKSGGVCLW